MQVVDRTSGYSNMANLFHSKYCDLNMLLHFTYCLRMHGCEMENLNCKMNRFYSICLIKSGMDNNQEPTLGITCSSTQCNCTKLLNLIHSI